MIVPKHSVSESNNLSKKSDIKTLLSLAVFLSALPTWASSSQSLKLKGGAPGCSIESNANDHLTLLKKFAISAAHIFVAAKNTNQVLEISEAEFTQRREQKDFQDMDGDVIFFIRPLPAPYGIQLEVAEIDAAVEPSNWHSATTTGRFTKKTNITLALQTRSLGIACGYPSK